MKNSLADRIKKRREGVGITAPAARVETAGLSLQERIDKLAEAIKFIGYDRFAVAEELNSILSDKDITQIRLAKQLSRTQGWISTKLALLTVPGERSKKIAITRSQAVEIAKTLRDIGIKYGLNIELSQKPTKAEIISALNRAKAIKSAVLKS